jgi:hypothetical protein
MPENIAKFSGVFLNDFRTLIFPHTEEVTGSNPVAPTKIKTGGWILIGSFRPLAFLAIFHIAKFYGSAALR